MRQFLYVSGTPLAERPIRRARFAPTGNNTPFTVHGGQTWHWSEPIEAVRWSEIHEDPKRFGGETIYLWEPAIFEQADGRIGLLIRNSTAQDDPERAEVPHRMLLYATSSDQGKT